MSQNPFMVHFSSKHHPNVKYSKNAKENLPLIILRQKIVKILKLPILILDANLNVQVLLSPKRKEFKKPARTTTD